MSLLGKHHAFYDIAFGSMHIDFDAIFAFLSEFGVDVLIEIKEQVHHL